MVQHDSMDCERYFGHCRFNESFLLLLAPIYTPSDLLYMYSLDHTSIYTIWSSRLVFKLVTCLATLSLSSFLCLLYDYYFFMFIYFYILLSIISHCSGFYYCKVFNYHVCSYVRSCSLSGDTGYTSLLTAWPFSMVKNYLYFI